MKQITESQLYQLFIEKLKNHSHGFVQDHHDTMLKKRVRSRTIESMAWDCRNSIKFDQPIDVIELGCSFGFLSFIDVLLGKQKINSWTGYDIDKTSINIANDLKQQLGLENTSFIHSAVSSIESDQVNTGPNDKLLAMELSYLLDDKTQPTRQVPNTHYKDLPACDIILIDIEGEEVNVDLKEIDFKICVLETNNNKATTMFEHFRSDDIKMLKQNIFTNPHGVTKGEFVFLKH